MIAPTRQTIMPSKPSRAPFGWCVVRPQINMPTETKNEIARMASTPHLTQDRIVFDQPDTPGGADGHTFPAASTVPPRCRARSRALIVLFPSSVTAAPSAPTSLPPSRGAGGLAAAGRLPLGAAGWAAAPAWVR